jgi:hypothetical protein
MKLFLTYRIKLLTPSSNAPFLVRTPSRVKSVFKAGVPEYDFDTPSALSAHTIENKFSIFSFFLPCPFCFLFKKKTKRKW